MLDDDDKALIKTEVADMDEETELAYLDAIVKKRMAKLGGFNQHTRYY